MKSTKVLTLEIKKLNQKLDQISSHSRFFVFTTNPFRFALYNFMAGIFHSLGSLFGTAVVAAAFIYLLAQFNITNYFTQFIENSLNQVRWEQIIPNITPQP